MYPGGARIAGRAIALAVQLADSSVYLLFVASANRQRSQEQQWVMAASISERLPLTINVRLCAFDLPTERFSFFELTDEKGGERLDRVTFADRRHRRRRSRLHASRSSGAYFGAGRRCRRSHALERSALVWQEWRTLRSPGRSHGRGERRPSDTPIWIGRKKAPPLALRLVAVPQAQGGGRGRAREGAGRRKARRLRHIRRDADGGRMGLFLSPRSMQRRAPPTEIGELYRARWRIELAFKRLKSLIGLSAPPSEDPETAKTWILAHLLMALLLEPHTSAPESLPAWPHNCAVVWRLTSLAAKALLAAFMPAPIAQSKLHRRLLEPPRKRTYQAIPALC